MTSVELQVIYVAKGTIGRCVALGHVCSYRYYRSSV